MAAAALAAAALARPRCGAACASFLSFVHVRSTHFLVRSVVLVRSQAVARRQWRHQQRRRQWPRLWRRRQGGGRGMAAVAASVSMAAAAACGSGGGGCGAAVTSIMSLLTVIIDQFRPSILTKV
uniref:Uncharacterized protein n=1 Tax=Oryza sativa subsp. japonica TaxID=39947 RepID=Q6ZFQ4_ORYSJ|nr:hypothetical protein [Oryza sativa Japonica Group]